MNNLSVAQSFMLCGLNEKGNFPVTNNVIPACLAAGSLIDLLLENCVSIADKKVYVTAPLTNNLLHLQPMYQYLNEKGTIKLEKLSENYCFTFSGKKINELTSSIGHSIVAQNSAVFKQGGILGNKEQFIPDRNAVDGVVQLIRAELLEDGNLSDEIVALTSLLEKSGILKRYFSSFEKDALKARLKEIRKAPSYAIIQEMLDYLDAMLIAVIVAAT